MRDGEKTGLDKPPAGAKRQRDPSARRIRMGQALLTGEARSVCEAGRLVGFSEATLKNPKGNNLQAHDLMKAAMAVETESLEGLKPIAVRTLKSVMEDDEEPGSTRVTAAGGVLRLLAEQYDGDEKRNILSPEQISLQIAGLVQGALLAAYRWALTNPTRAIQAIERIEQTLPSIKSRLVELELLDKVGGARTGPR